MNTTSNQSNPYAPPEAKVEDAVDRAEIELAGRGERLGAALLDILTVFIAVYVPLIIGIGSNFMRLASDPESIVEILPAIGIAGLFSLIGATALIVVTIRLVLRNGQTIGKKILDIKVVRSDGSRASLGRIFWMRNVIGWVISAIPRIGGLFGLVDSLFIFADSRQCLHDKIADTIVIKA